MDEFTYATVCSGIEAPSMAWEPLGWKPVFFSEIEKFPCEVLSFRHPNVPNLGDMTKIKGEDYAGKVRFFCGGTPCQGFSQAGLRKGLDDPRSHLALVFLRLVDSIRPRWIIWENVAGALSANQRRDFGAFIGALGDIGYGYAWRVLDAQYFGLAQRRKRVFLVGHFGDWRPPAAVLFEHQSLSGHPAPDGKKEKTNSEVSGGGPSESGDIDDKYLIQRIAGTLGGSSQDGGFRTTDLDNTGAFVPVTFSAEMTATQFSLNHDLSPTLCTKHTVAMVMRNGDTTVDGVRRLTPLEWERLMGFPDGYTKIPRGKKPAEDCPDTPRYKALGNSIAVPVLSWIGNRVVAVEKILADGSESALEGS